MKRTPEFIQLLTSSQSRLYGYLLSLVFDPDLANDLLQQTNVVLWEKESDFEIGTNFIAWSFRIAYFQVLAQRKQMQREKLAFDSDLLVDIAQTATQSSETFEDRQRMMRRCLEKLNQRQREFIRRRYDVGSTLDSIAAETEMTVNAVKQLLFRARTTLTECINRGVQRDLSS